MFLRTGSAPLEAYFEIAPAAVSPSTTRVLQVYPTATVLPENQLKLYIEFSGPMSKGEAWQHLRLLKDDGIPVDLPFLEIDQEMWDTEGRRLTVLFDPGRIKRGVLPLDEVGPAIEAGRRYTLVIDAKWRDASGLPLASGHRKEFRVAEADRGPIEPAQWRTSPIQTGTREPLIVQFRESLDYALAQRLIWVESAAGPLRGRIEIGAEERTWRLTPEAPWPDAPLNLSVDTALEDLAGNRVGRPFDVDTFERVSRRVERTIMSLALKHRVGAGDRPGMPGRPGRK
jgi:hypothetical protein